MRLLEEGSFEPRKTLVIQAQLHITNILTFLKLKISLLNNLHHYWF